MLLAGLDLELDTPCPILEWEITKRDGVHARKPMLFHSMNEPIDNRFFLIRVLDS